MPNPTIVLIGAISVLLILAAITMFISKWSRLPFTVMLVVMGYAASHLAKYGPPFLTPLATYKIHPDIILYACLPTLIFESAFAMDARLLKHNLAPVLTLAIPGLFLSTAIIGLIVWSLTSFPLLTALLLGAILSATDPVAVISLFKQLGVPKRLTILVEGESSFNDSTAIVTAKTILIIMLAGSMTSTTLFHSMHLFLFEFFGGIVIGFIMALITGSVIAAIEDEPLTELSLTIILAYLSFIMADKFFHISGVMATITAGIMMSGWGRTKLSSHAVEKLHDILEFLAYIANALIFLLVGLSIQLQTLADSFWIITIVIFAMLFSRAIVIYALVPLIGKLPNAEPIDIRYQTIMWWGGLRGAIALAIVLGLSNMPDQETLISVVMGAVLFTILVQGLSIEKIIHYLRLDRLLLPDRVAKMEAEIAAEKITLERIPELQRGGLFSLIIAKDLQAACKRAIAKINSRLQRLRKNELTLKEEERLLFLSAFAVEKSLYYDMFSNGHLTEHAYRLLTNDIDLEVDLMRYRGTITETAPIGFIGRVKTLFIGWFRNVPVLNRLPMHMQLMLTLRDYEEKWGLHQGSLVVLNHLNELEKIESFKQEAIDVVKNRFKSWLTATTHYLDEITAQFPEFVNDMQQRLAQRLLLLAKYHAVMHQVKEGLLPQGIADALIQKYLIKIRKLSKPQPEKLKLDPHELIRNVPFFRYIPADKVDSIIDSLRECRVAAGNTIINEGEPGEKLYLIMRGVVRVIKEKEGRPLELATLMAGDFFGEMVLLYDTKRTATCKAITPCLLYTLDRKTFNELKNRFPAIERAIAEEAEKRGE